MEELNTPTSEIPPFSEMVEKFQKITDTPIDVIIDIPHYETTKEFNRQPPIPELNLIIDNATLEVIEDCTGQP
jgi:hypothetical protein